MKYEYGIPSLGAFEMIMYVEPLSVVLLLLNTLIGFAPILL